MPEKRGPGRPRKQPKVERIPFGGRRSKLQVSENIPGYVLRWVNDVDGRIHDAQKGGYEFVLKSEAPSVGDGQLHQDNSDINARVSKIVSRGKTDPIRAFLMKIRKEWYIEDQQAKEEINREIDDALRAGQPGGNVVENQYVPKGHKQVI